MIFRLYFFFKSVLEPQANDLKNFQRFTQGCKPTVWFSFKINLMKKSELTIFIMFLTSVLVFSYMILLFDLDTFLDTADDRTDSPLFLAVYQIVITLTSVGYGDFYPKSWLGRSVIMICAIWGAVLISFIVLVTSNIFSLSETQENAL